MIEYWQPDNAGDLVSRERGEQGVLSPSSQQVFYVQAKFAELGYKMSMCRIVIMYMSLMNEVMNILFLF